MEILLINQRDISDAKKSRKWWSRTLLLDVLILSLGPVLLFWRTLSSPTSLIGMSNTDTEGTLWWIWSSCKGYLENGVAKHVALPHGFDFGQFATYSLIDQIRALLIRPFGCDPRAAIATIALLPVVALLLNIWSGYLLGHMIFQRRLAGFALALAGLASSQILLSTRTSLANILLAPGVVAIGFAVLYKTKRWFPNILLCGLLITVQFLCNAYNGFAFFVIVGVLLSSNIGATESLAARMRSLMFLAISGLIGIIPIAHNQFYLYLDRSDGTVIRPVDSQAEVVDPRVLLSRGSGWISDVLPSSWPRPESGWIALPLLVATLWAVPRLLRPKQRNHFVQLGRTALGLSLVFLVFIYRIPGFGWIRSAYFEVLYPLRGVSNYAKVLPLLLCITALSALFAGPVDRMHLRARHRLSFALVLILNVLDNVPAGNTLYTRTSLKPVSDFYAQFPPSSGHLVAHFPDYNYAGNWGFPLRFVQLAQVFTDERVANGRPLSDINERCLLLPLPDNNESYEILLNRGISRIVIHRNLVSAAEIERVVVFMRSRGLREARIHSSATGNNLDIYRALDVSIFDLKSDRQMTDCQSHDS